MNSSALPGVTPAFARTIRGAFGAAGEQWLACLPAIVADATARWSLTLGPPFDLSYHYVVSATRPNGSPVVLKAGVPRRDLTNEIAALRLYDGRGAVRLLDADAARGLFLLERLVPGTPLSTLANDDEATTIAANVMGGLRHPPPPGHGFPTVANWAAGLGRLRPHFGGGTGPFPAPLVDRAEGLFADLLASSAPPVVLHGDLHHDNILDAGPAGWLAIDPQGVVGEPAYETGALLRNPIGRLPAMGDLRPLLARRVALLAELLDLDGDRIAAWALAQAVLSAWWDVEDGGPEDGWRLALAVAEALA